MKEISSVCEFDFLMCFKKPKVLIFYHYRCGECDKLFHLIEILETRYTGTNFVYINTDMNKELVNEFNITHVPTMIFTSNGQEIVRTVGYRGYEDITSILDNNSFE